ncbi:hypothetical protein H696_00903 [Fonticula alba]|uniref:DUF2428 domain-containing protein n=1 Tax=Fonticula alba TaxID=691883 RepID=A0A058ZG71_FONAL|nr:hypothetical protein H696_00903 [Fonticula alba]KCV73364.1 hypothetical protein H696_00903 [Fonticula alba]|eukprot:XP_009493065.1 hypothetical protein H696_00903 [Fonticula alba]
MASAAPFTPPAWLPVEGDAHFRCSLDQSCHLAVESGQAPLRQWATDLQAALRLDLSKASGQIGRLADAVGLVSRAPAPEADLFGSTTAEQFAFHFAGLVSACFFSTDQSKIRRPLLALMGNLLRAVARSEAPPEWAPSVAPLAVVEALPGALRLAADYAGPRSQLVAAGILLTVDRLVLGREVPLPAAAAVTPAEVLAGPGPITSILPRLTTLDALKLLASAAFEEPIGVAVIQNRFAACLGLLAGQLDAAAASLAGTADPGAPVLAVQALHIQAMSGVLQTLFRQIPGHQEYGRLLGAPGLVHGTEPEEPPGAQADGDIVPGLLARIVIGTRALCMTRSEHVPANMVFHLSMLCGQIVSCPGWSMAVRASGGALPAPVTAGVAHSDALVFDQLLLAHLGDMRPAAGLAILRGMFGGLPRAALLSEDAGLLAVRLPRVLGDFAGRGLEGEDSTQLQSVLADWTSELLRLARQTGPADKQPSGRRAGGTPAKAPTDLPAGFAFADCQALLQGAGLGWVLDYVIQVWDNSLANAAAPSIRTTLSNLLSLMPFLPAAAEGGTFGPQAFLSRILSLGWHSKAMYKALRLAIAHIDLLAFEDTYRAVVAGTLAAFTTYTQCAFLASDLLEGCLQLAAKSVSDPAARRAVVMGWIRPIVDIILQEHSAETRRDIETYCLRIVLRVAPENLILLLEEVLAREPGLTPHAFARAPNQPWSWLSALVALVRLGREESLLDMGMFSEALGVDHPFVSILPPLTPEEEAAAAEQPEDPTVEGPRRLPRAGAAKLRQIFSLGRPVVSYFLLEQALSVSNSFTRLGALGIICNSHKIEPLSPRETHLLLRVYLPNALQESSTEFRHEQSILLGRLFRRVRDSYYSLHYRRRRQCDRDGGSLTPAEARRVADLDAAIARTEAFVTDLLRFFVGRLQPGARFQQVSTCLDWLHALVPTLGIASGQDMPLPSTVQSNLAGWRLPVVDPVSGKSIIRTEPPGGGITEADVLRLTFALCSDPADPDRQAAEQQSLLTALVAVLLDTALFDTYRRTQGQALGLLRQMHAPWPGVSTPAMASVYFASAFRVAVHNTRGQPSDAAAGVLGLLFEKYIIGLGWRLAGIEPAARVADTPGPGEDEDPVRHSLDQLLGALEADAAMARGDLWEASQRRPAFGTLNVTRGLLAHVNLAGVQAGTPAGRAWSGLLLRLTTSLVQQIEACREPLSVPAPEGNSAADVTQLPGAEGDFPHPGLGDEDMTAGDVSDDESPDADQTGGWHQVLTSVCWRSIKAACALLVELLSRAGHLMAPHSLADVTRYFVSLLLTMRHIGGISALYTNLAELFLLLGQGGPSVKGVLDLPPAEVAEAPYFGLVAGPTFIGADSAIAWVLPAALLAPEAAAALHHPTSDPRPITFFELVRAGFERLLFAGKSLSITRRSAGLPVMFRILFAPILHTPEGQALLRTTIRTLLDIARWPARDTASGMNFPQVHSLNVLHGMAVHSSFATLIEPFISDAFELSITHFSSQCWDIRNSGMMLFSALLGRVFGPAKNLPQSDGELTLCSFPHTSASDAAAGRLHHDALATVDFEAPAIPAASSHRLTAWKFFSQHPQLLAFVGKHVAMAVNELAPSTGGADTVNVAVPQPGRSLFPILSLLSRFAPVLDQSSLAGTESQPPAGMISDSSSSGTAASPNLAAVLSSDELATLLATLSRDLLTCARGGTYWLLRGVAVRAVTAIVPAGALMGQIVLPAADALRQDLSSCSSSSGVACPNALHGAALAIKMAAQRLLPLVSSAAALQDIATSLCTVLAELLALTGNSMAPAVAPAHTALLDTALLVLHYLPQWLEAAAAGAPVPDVAAMALAALAAEVDRAAEHPALVRLLVRLVDPRSMARRPDGPVVPGLDLMLASTARAFVFRHIWGPGATGAGPLSEDLALAVAALAGCAPRAGDLAAGAWSPTQGDLLRSRLLPLYAMASLSAAARQEALFALVQRLRFATASATSAATMSTNPGFLVLARHLTRQIVGQREPVPEVAAVLLAALHALLHVGGMALAAGIRSSPGGDLLQQLVASQLADLEAGVAEQRVTAATAPQLHLLADLLVGALANGESMSGEQEARLFRSLGALCSERGPARGRLAVCRALVALLAGADHRAWPLLRPGSRAGAALCFHLALLLQDDSQTVRDAALLAANLLPALEVGAGAGPGIPPLVARSLAVTRLMCLSGALCPGALLDLALEHFGVTAAPAAGDEAAWAGRLQEAGRELATSAHLWASGQRPVDDREATDAQEHQPKQSATDAGGIRLPSLRGCQLFIQEDANLYRQPSLDASAMATSIGFVAAMADPPVDVLRRLALLVILLKTQALLALPHLQENPLVRQYATDRLIILGQLAGTLASLRNRWPDLFPAGLACDDVLHMAAKDRGDSSPQALLGRQVRLVLLAADSYMNTATASAPTTAQ